MTTTDTLRTETANDAAAPDFVRRFQETWAAPTPERLNQLVHADIEFIQPMQPAVHGHAEAAAFWRHLLSMIPDLTGEVVSWAARGGTVFIELRMRGTLGGEPVEWVTLDRIHLEDGKVRQRIAYFDPLPLIRAIVVRPRALGAWLRANARRLTRR
jgi:ketosteroid isomerase-like protein